MTADYQTFAAQFAASSEAAPYLEAMRTFRVLRGPGKPAKGHASEVYPDAELVTQFALCMSYIKMFSGYSRKTRGLASIYGLKHRVEAWAKSMGSPYLYVHEEVMRAALRASGYTIGQSRDAYVPGAMARWGSPGARAERCVPVPLPWGAAPVQACAVASALTTLLRDLCLDADNLPASAAAAMDEALARIEADAERAWADAFAEGVAEGRRLAAVEVTRG